MVGAFDDVDAEDGAGKFLIDERRELQQELDEIGEGLVPRKAVATATAALVRRRRRRVDVLLDGRWRESLCGCRRGDHQDQRG